MRKKKVNLRKSTLELENRVPYRFSIIADLGMRCLADMFVKRYRISIPEWSVLAVIAHFEPMFPSDVAVRTSMQVDKVTRTVDRLVASDLVVRKPDDADRRRISLRLTAKGQKIHREIDHIRRILETEFLSVLSEKESKAFFDALNKLERQAKLLYSGRDSWKSIVALYEPELVTQVPD